MHFQSIVAGLALVAHAAARPANTVEGLLARQSLGECAHMSGGLHVIAVGGGGLAVGGNPKEYGYLSTLSGNITSAIPGSTSVSVPYNKVTTKNDSMAIPNGVTNLVQYINGYHKYCPDTKIALIGYSSGAVIIMNTLCGGRISSSLSENTIIADIIYGDETRSASDPYNVGTCTNGYGISPRPSGQCGAFIPIIQSYCDASDPYCCLPNGNNILTHFVYPTEYDVSATNYIIAQAQKFGPL